MYVMIPYLMFVGSRCLRGGLVSLKTSWICILGCEDVFLSVVSLLASCIVLTDLESRKFTFIELYMLICMF